MMPQEWYVRQFGTVERCAGLVGIQIIDQDRFDSFFT